MFHVIRTAAVAFLFLCLGASLAMSQDVEQIILWDKSMQHREILKIILDETVRDHGPYEIVSSVPMEDGRALIGLQDGEGLDVMSAPATNERHSMLLPLNLPTHVSFLGYRILYVREGEESLLETVKTLQDLQRSGLVFGSGMHWADTEILEANGLQTETSAVTAQLNEMLRGKRFDVFPRGLGEVLRDVGNPDTLGQWQGIVEDRHVVLVYPFREIFYLGRKNYRLRARLHTGFQRAVESGAWGRYFSRTINEVLDDLTKLNLSARTVIRLDNPSMPEAVKAISPEFDPLDPKHYPQYGSQ